MPEKNTISVSDFEQAALSDLKEESEFEWNGLLIKVRRNIGLNEMLTFVDYVIKVCFDYNTGEYLPEVKDFAIQSAFMRYYTNVELPNDTSRRYDLLCASNIYECIYKENLREGKLFCFEQYYSILDAIDDKLHHIAHSNVNKLMQEFEGAAKGFADILEQMSGIFDGVDPESLAGFVSAISDGVLNEGELVNAIVNSGLASKRQESTNESVSN